MNIDREIPLNSEMAELFGFTSKNGFDGYLWQTENDTIKKITISSITSSKGYLLTLFSNILSLGYTVAVPTPFPKMEAILRKRGFVPTSVYDETFDDYCELWIKKPTWSNDD